VPTEVRSQLTPLQPARANADARTPNSFIAPLDPSREDVTPRRHFSTQHTSTRHISSPAHQHPGTSAHRHIGTRHFGTQHFGTQHFSERSPPSLRLTQALVLALVGALLGVALSAPVFLAISASVSGLGALNPWTMVGVPVGLVGIAVAACWAPALRATRISPTIALRTE
jgi:hypothetical protein